jgi:cytochrome c
MTMRSEVASLSLFALALSACETKREPTRADSAPTVTVAQSAPQGDTPRGVDLRPHYRGIGRPATAAEVRAWNIDVNGSGTGLPGGRGTYARGAQLYAQQCASCHGAKGEGIAPNPRLVGTEPSDFSFGRDPKLVKTIGNYWPYATTLYDYINRSMPFNAPGSLRPDDLYSIVAFLLVENRVIDTSMVIDARSLPRVHMPARDRFVLDDRKGGATFR